MTTTADQGLFVDSVADGPRGRRGWDLARRKTEEAWRKAEAAAPSAPAAVVPAEPTVREGLARMLRPRRRTQTLPSWFSHRDAPSRQSVRPDTAEQPPAVQISP